MAARGGEAAESLTVGSRYARYSLNALDSSGRCFFRSGGGRLVLVAGTGCGPESRIGIQGRFGGRFLESGAQGRMVRAAYCGHAGRCMSQVGTRQKENGWLSLPAATSEDVHWQCS